MSTTETPVSEFELETTPGEGGISEAARAYWERIKGGDLGEIGRASCRERVFGYV